MTNPMLCYATLCYANRMEYDRIGRMAENAADPMLCYANPSIVLYCTVLYCTVLFCIVL
jgi:hypothetical protein